MERLNQNYIATQLNVRDALLDRAYDEKEAGNKKRHKTYDLKADQIQDVITKDILKHFGDYAVDEVLETLTRFGQAPNLVYDDNGKWAVSGDGYQPVVTDDEVINGGLTVSVTGHMWKKTIREAVWHYMTYEWKLEDESEEMQKMVKILDESTQDFIDGLKRNT